MSPEGGIAAEIKSLVMVKSWVRPETMMCAWVCLSWDMLLNAVSAWDRDEW